jgi:probable HAF family extracellular repeat protein
VGYSDYEPTNFYMKAFLYSNGTMIDLNSLLPANSGWQLIQANGINDSGQIVGTGFLNGQQSGFLLDLDTATAAPEPRSIMLILPGIGLVAVRKYLLRRRRRFKGSSEVDFLGAPAGN